MDLGRYASVSSVRYAIIRGVLICCVWLSQSLSALIVSLWIPAATDSSMSCKTTPTYFARRIQLLLQSGSSSHGPTPASFPSPRGGRRAFRASPALPDVGLQFLAATSCFHFVQSQPSVTCTLHAHLIWKVESVRLMDGPRMLVFICEFCIPWHHLHRTYMPSSLLWVGSSDTFSIAS